MRFVLALCCAALLLAACRPEVVVVVVTPTPTAFWKVQAGAVARNLPFAWAGAHCTFTAAADVYAGSQDEGYIYLVGKGCSGWVPLAEASPR